MKRIWVDDERPMPKKYDIHIKSVYEFIVMFNRMWMHDCLDHSLLIDLDHDAGSFSTEGGDYIKILEYLEYLNRTYTLPFTFTFMIHSGNPVGRENMIRIIESNNWKYQN